jgi:hypothetical protein
MASRNRKIYDVDEDVLKRVVAGDTAALEEMADDGASSSPKRKDTKDGEKDVAPLHGAPPEQEAYRKRFLTERLKGTRRQTYIHDALYRAIAGVLPVIAPDLSVPAFVNNVLSDHLKQYEEIINGIYNEKATQKPIQWKK